MALLKLKVLRQDGTSDTYRVLPITRVAFERYFKIGIGAVADQKREEHLFWLAWDSERRAGTVVPPFDNWVDALEDVEVEDDEAPSTAPEAATAGASPSSPA